MSKESKKGANDDVPMLDSDPFFEANAKAKSRYGRFNLAVIGGTGVGKSSLVNAVFERDLARVGKGMPVTEGVHYYHDQSLGIWDVEGFEIGKSPSDALRQHLAAITNRPAEEQIAIVWFCVNATSDRLTQADVQIIRELDAAGLPVILVLTKVAWTKTLTGDYKAPKGVEDFRGWLEDPVDSDGEAVNIPFREVVLTSAERKNGKGAGHGLGDLLSKTLQLSPDDAKDAFRIAQRLNLPWKRQLARPVINAAAAAAVAAAAVPIPVTDAATLAPIQLAMMGRISAIFDLELKTMLSVSTVAQLSAQIAGRALARSFIKLIPGAGSVVSASVAGALTYAAGESWLRFCEQIHSGKLDLTKIDEAWRDFSPSLVTIIKNLAEQRFSKSSEAANG